MKNIILWCVLCMNTVHVLATHYAVTVVNNAGIPVSIKLDIPSQLSYMQGSGTLYLKGPIAVGAIPNMAAGEKKTIENNVTVADAAGNPVDDSIVYASLSVSTGNNEWRTIQNIPATNGTTTVTLVQKKKNARTFFAH